MTMSIQQNHLRLFTSRMHLYFKYSFSPHSDLLPLPPRSPTNTFSLSLTFTFPTSSWSLYGPNITTHVHAIPAHTLNHTSHTHLCASITDTCMLTIYDCQKFLLAHLLQERLPLVTNHCHLLKAQLKSFFSMEWKHVCRKQPHAAGITAQPILCHNM